MKYTGLVLEGGGVKGLAHCGAISILNEEGILKDFNKFAGSSVGSLIAGLLACNASIKFICDEIWKLDLREFKDDSWGVFKDIYRLLWKFGWYKGDKLYDYYSKIIEQVTQNAPPGGSLAACSGANITFQEVYERYGNELVITTTKLYKDGGETIYLSRHTYPNMPIVKAARLSAGVPYFFESLILDDYHTTDGGLLNNYPIDVFDYNGIINQEIIGIRLFSNNNTPSKKEYSSKIKQPIYDIKDYSMAIISALYNQAEKIHVKNSDLKRTIKVDTGDVSTMDMDINTKTKHFLFNNGRTGMKEFIKNN